MTKLEYLLKVQKDCYIQKGSHIEFVFAVEDLLKAERKRLNKRKQTRRNRCK